jgi:tRNA pseudouridine32 synthase/23S rRNA pseudouridine746 synthase
MTPEEMLARLLYRDGLMLVIDKPAGLAVHRGPKGGESLEDYFDALRFGLPRAPALAHRLDRDTSGCLVLGRHRKALAALGKMFKNGKVGKTYWAVVEGGPAEDEGRIEIALAKRDESRGWWMKPDPQGLPSVTTWKVMGRSFLYPSPTELGPARVPHDDAQVGQARLAWGGSSRSDGMGAEHAATPPGSLRAPPSPQAGRDFTWLAMEPVTGRTHQLRVHAAEMGWPIVGDTIYGKALRDGGKIQERVARSDAKPASTFAERAPVLHLLSREVVVPISKNKPPVTVTAPVPEHMRERLKACGWNGTESASP